MRVLILCGSPKRRGGASYLLGRMLGALLPGREVTYASLRSPGDRSAALAQLPGADAVVLAAPLYVDGVPSHVLEFLEQAEALCAAQPCHFTLYAVSNNGFIEGRHNRVHLMQYPCWCRRAGAAWGGGLGVGGGEMFQVLAVYFPLALAGLLVWNLIRLALGMAVRWTPLLRCLGVFAFFLGGIFYGLIRLAAAVARGRRTRDRFTRVLVPSFLFIPMADLFMILSALFRGKNIFKLLKKDEYT